jgi:C4-dicarboxylate-specific signal transduction histidine kinase
MRTNATPPLLVVAAIFMTAAIFVLDTITHLEVAVGVLYVAVVLIAVRVFHQGTVLLVSGGCVGLTVLSAYLSLTEPLRAAGLINCIISITAIVATTYLGLKNQSANLALQDARMVLAHVNRLATLGELTAAIAHEVNQPIAGAVTNAEAALNWLAAEPPDLREVHQALGAVVEDGKRASEIIARIRGMLANTPPRRERLNINAVIVEVIRLMRSEIQRNRVSLQTSLSNELPGIVGDRIQLQQVVLNLMLNAVEAISDKGQQPRELFISTEKQDASSILVTVRDSGAGLDLSSLDQVFQPFHTSKSGSIGVGLSICRSIVEAHGGRIWASASGGGGASFHFSLPAVTAKACRRTVVDPF